MEPWALRDSLHLVQADQIEKAPLCAKQGKRNSHHVTQKSDELTSVWLISEESHDMLGCIFRESNNQGAGCAFGREGVVENQVMERALDARLHQNSSVC